MPTGVHHTVGASDTDWIVENGKELGPEGIVWDESAVDGDIAQSHYAYIKKGNKTWFAEFQVARRVIPAICEYSKRKEEKVEVIKASWM